MPAVRVIVTRPLREALRWVGGLREVGIDSVALPLIAIAEVDDVAPIREAWRQIDRYRALMFVSASAVDHFFRHRPAGQAQVPRCWATGPGTASALLKAGVAPSLIDLPSADAAQFDSEALWRIVGAQVTPGDRVLVVRGGNADGKPAGRDWLAEEIRDHGGICDPVAAYRRLPPPLAAVDLRLAETSAQRPALWLFSSSEAVGNLRRCLPSTSWEKARAVATHPRIAQAAHDAGFGTVAEARPVFDAVVASIESLR